MCLWDFGLNPTCIITQISPMTNWLVHECYVGDGIGTYELIQDIIKGRIEDRFKGLPISHYGDPQGKQREQSSVDQTAVKVIKTELGGRWYPGPREWQERRDSSKRVLGLLRNGVGLVQIDEKRAKPLWHALRGGWHYKKHANGIISNLPIKDIHSHPGDAFGYGAAILFPAGERKTRGMNGAISIRQPSYFRQNKRFRPPYDPRGDVQQEDDAAEPPLSVPGHGDMMPGTGSRIR
jgi:hypothetical protein